MVRKSAGGAEVRSGQEMCFGRVEDLRISSEFLLAARVRTRSCAVCSSALNRDPVSKRDNRSNQDRYQPPLGGRGGRASRQGDFLLARAKKKIDASACTESTKDHTNSPEAKREEKRRGKRGRQKEAKSLLICGLFNSSPQMQYAS